MTFATIVTGLLVFGRVGGLLLALPVFSAQGVPRHVTVFGALALTLVMGPVAPLAEDPRTLTVLVVGLGTEVLLGLLLGSVVRAVFGALALAAEVMSGQTGLAMATLFDPMLRSNQGTMGTFASWIAAAMFLGTGLHLQCIEVVAGSFQVVPPGGTTALLSSGVVLLEAIAATVVLGVQLSGPVVALVWMVNVFVAVLSRLAPNMNVFFSVGMVLTNVAGILLFGLALPYLLLVHHGALSQSADWMLRLLAQVH